MGGSCRGSRLCSHNLQFRLKEKFTAISNRFLKTTLQSSQALRTVGLAAVREAWAAPCNGKARTVFNRRRPRTLPGRRPVARWALCTSLLFYVASDPVRVAGYQSAFFSRKEHVGGSEQLIEGNSEAPWTRARISVPPFIWTIYITSLSPNFLAYEMRNPRLFQRFLRGLSEVP